MASSLGSLVVSLGLDAAQYVTGLTKAELQSKKFAREVEQAAKLAGAAIGTAIVAGAAWAKSSIDAADAAIKQAQAVGLAVEEYTALTYASGLAGVGQDELAGAMTKLSKQARDARDGVKTSAEAFDRLGISVTDSDGKLKSSSTLLEEIAARFEEMPAGIEKTAAATDFFGRSGAKLIPLLNGGAEGLKAMRMEAEAMGAVIDTELAQQSEQFNDNLSRLGTLATGAGNDLARALLPSLNDLAALLVDLGKESRAAGDGMGWLQVTADAANIVLKGVLIVGSEVVFALSDLGRELASTAAQAVALSKLDIDGFRAISEAVEEDTARARKDLDDFQRRVLAIGKRSETFIGVENDARRGRGFVPPEPPAQGGRRPPRAGGGSAPKSKPLETDTLLIYQADQLREAFDLIERINTEAARGALASAPTTDTLLIYEADRLREAFDAIEEVNKEAERGLGKVKDAAADLGFVFSSAFEEAIVGGKKFGEVLKGIGQDILRILVRQNITGPLATAIQGFDFGSLLSGLPGFAIGTDYVPRDMVARIHKGERIIPAAENVRGSMGGAIKVEVVNPPGRALEASASTQQTPQGTVLRLVLQEIAKDIGTGGQVSRAMQGTFGLSRAAGAPRRG